MENKPSLDVAILIPIAIGIFSVFGLCLVLLLGSIATSRNASESLETATPFDYILLGTEPGVSTALPDEEMTAAVTKTPTRFSPPTRVPVRTFTPEIESTKPSVIAATRTPTTASTAPLNPGTYDDGDSRIAYSGAWIPQVGVPNAENNTLHVSSTLGSTINFRFIGQQVRLFHQASPSLGTMRVVIDGLQIDVDQSVDEDEWVSALLINGTHTVTITHLSGGSINLDYVIVPDVLLTPTVTTTP
jgi:hypothetical protein